MDSLPYATGHMGPRNQSTRRVARLRRAPDLLEMPALTGTLPLAVQLRAALRLRRGKELWRQDIVST